MGCCRVCDWGGLSGRRAWNGDALDCRLVSPLPPILKISPPGRDCLRVFISSPSSCPLPVQQPRRPASTHFFHHAQDGIKVKAFKKAFCLSCPPRTCPCERGNLFTKAAQGKRSSKWQQLPVELGWYLGMHCWVNFLPFWILPTLFILSLFGVEGNPRFSYRNGYDLHFSSFTASRQLLGDTRGMHGKNADRCQSCVPTDGDCMHLQCTVPLVHRVGCTKWCLRARRADIYRVIGAGLGPAALQEVVYGHFLKWLGTASSSEVRLTVLLYVSSLVTSCIMAESRCWQAKKDF